MTKNPILPKSKCPYLVFTVWIIFIAQIFLGIHIYKIKLDQARCVEASKDLIGKELARIWSSELDKTLRHSSSTGNEKTNVPKIILENPGTAKLRRRRRFVNLSNLHCGQQGLPGPQGTPGVQGPRGSPGLLGIPGRNGLTGPIGPPGVRGLPGVPGRDGAPGLAGIPGKEGQKGDIGVPGPQGAMGLPGIQGQKGDTGIPVLPDRCPAASKPEIHATQYGNVQYPGLSSRIDKCLLCNIDNDNVNIMDQTPFGPQMVDFDQITSKKIWSATDSTLYEFEGDINEPTRTYDLNPPMQGMDNVMYKNAFVYNAKESPPRVVKFSLDNQSVQILDIPGLTSKNSRPLYKNSGNYLDISVDDNGLWGIFSVPDINHTAVMKLDTDKMEIQSVLNISINNQLFDEMFVASGILYAINGSRLNGVLDLYNKNAVHIDLAVDDFGGIKTATYDYKNKKLWVLYDGETMITYPVTCQK